MLLVKPCIVLNSSPPEEEQRDGMIEFQNMGMGDESDEMNEGGSGSITEESELMEGGGQIEDKDGKGLVNKR
jgi:hypothetical protein